IEVILELVSIDSIWELLLSLNLTTILLIGTCDFGKYNDLETFVYV
ncbi:11324_t:CDS:2, partial [Racocetra persica]